MRFLTPFLKRWLRTRIEGSKLEKKVEGCVSWILDAKLRVETPKARRKGVTEIIKFYSWKFKPGKEMRREFLNRYHAEKCRYNHWYGWHTSFYACIDEKKL